jgi:hypothetical protein
MGKQSRRHKNHKKHNQAGNGAIRAKGNAAPLSKLNIVNKIRHGDVRVRHGALSALSTTTFSPEHLSKNGTNKSIIGMELIKAIAERILDDDVPISSCALGCIGNYVIFQDLQPHVKQQHPQGMESLLTPILLSKMKLTCDFIEAFLQENSTSSGEAIEADDRTGTQNTIHRKALIMMEQWSILSLCLHALCGVIESITTTNDSSSAILHVQKQDFLSNTFRAFALATKMIMTFQNAGTHFEKMLSAKENDSNIISDVLVYTTRTLHSSCDDNLDILSTIFEADQEWNQIESSITNSCIPMLARLHSCGIVIAASQMRPENDRLSKTIVSLVVPLLHQCAHYHGNIAQALYTQVNESYIVLRKEKDDEAIEKDIIRMVDKRKESARSIARRQKEMKNIKNDDDNDINGNQEKLNNALPYDEPIQAEELYEKSIISWKNACLPLKLSVEIIANVFTIGGPENFYDDNEQENGWDMEDDFPEEPTNGHEMMKQSSTTRPKETEELLRRISNAGLPDKVLVVFGDVLLEIMNNGSTNSIPKEALDDLVEVVTKCGLCLCNAFCNLDHWKEKDDECIITWKQLVNILNSVKDMSTHANVSSVIPLPVIASVVSTMCSMMRFRSQLVQSVDENDLNLIMSFLSIQPSKDNGEMEVDDSMAVSDIQKDCVGMLGILCSRPHSDDVNEMICCLLLDVLIRSNSTSVAVISEILSVLMDMYSADEGDPGNHECVFRKNNVIQAFEKAVPQLKRKIRDEEMKDIIEDDLEYWKETAFNAMRFIRYKKGISK